MPAIICPRKESEPGLILRGVKCQTAPSSHERKINSPFGDNNIQMHQFPYAFKWLLIRGSFYFNLTSQQLEKEDLAIIFAVKLFLLNGILTVETQMPPRVVLKVFDFIPVIGFVNTSATFFFVSVHSKRMNILLISSRMN